MKRVPIRYAIFDLDGTLIDTEGTYTKAIQTYLDRHKPGARFTPDVKRRMMGGSVAGAVQLVLDHYGIDESCDAALAETLDIFNELVKDVPALPGAYDVVRCFRRNGIPLALATGTERLLLPPKVANHGALLALFDVIICGDDSAVPHPKPAPDIFLHAARMLGCEDMSQCVIFEDSLFGVQAAQAAGAQIVAVPDPCVRDDPTFSRMACVLNSLEDWKPYNFGLGDSL